MGRGRFGTFGPASYMHNGSAANGNVHLIVRGFQENAILES
jgi:hypothetical protein